MSNRQAAQFSKISDGGIGSFLPVNLDFRPKTYKVNIEFNQKHAAFLTTYRQGFGKYARNLQVKYVELLFGHIPLQLGQKFKYTDIEGEFRKRELAPALDLLVTAGVAQKVYASARQGIPLGTQIDPLDYKVIFLDIALAQTMLGLQAAGWYINPLAEFVNRSKKWRESYS